MNGKVYQAGLFGYVNAGAKVENLNVSGTVISTNQCVGGIVGNNKGTVINCHSNVTVTGGTQTGGVVGNNGGTVEGCSYTGTVTGTGSYTGGIVGYGEGTVIRCYNIGTVEGVNYVGGIIGSNGNSMENCYNIGDISGQKEIGGLAGFNFGSSSYSYSTGKVSGTSDTGFLFGTKQGEVTNSYFLSDTPVEEEKGGTYKTSAQFASGEVAYLLNNGVTDGTQVFYQTCGEGLPVFSGETVYQVKHYHCPGDTIGTDIYSNVNENITGEHSYTQETANEQYLQSAATCTEAAVYYKSCAVCGQPSATETFTYGTPAGHNFENGKCTVCNAADPDFQVLIIAGANSTWQKSGKDGLPFTSNAAFADFLKVQVDGNDLAQSNYDIKEGSTIVTLKAEYLETLSVGKHTLSIISASGTATTEFTILAASAGVINTPQTPQTGDNSNVVLWIVGMLAAGAVLTGALLYNHKRKYNK